MMLKLKTLAAVFAIVAVLTVGVAAFSGGNGSASSPYVIANADDLSELVALSESSTCDGKYFVQSADITASDITVSPSESYPFMGEYDGFDYDIYGVSGLFGYAEDAVIKNIHIKDATLAIGECAGGIVSKALGTTLVAGCSFTGTIADYKDNVLGAYTGGIAGSLGENASITKCTVNITSRIEQNPFILFVGGIVGTNNGTVSECTANGSITALSKNYIVSVGGIAGENTHSITGCKNNIALTGEISASAAQLYIGGIAGLNTADGVIIRCHNAASVKAIGISTFPCYAGGIAGYNNNGSISNSKNTGSLEASISYLGGISGINHADNLNSDIENCLNAGGISGSESVIGGLVGGNIANEKSTNKASVTASLNLAEITDGDAAIGEVATDGVGVSEVTGLVVRNAAGNTYAASMTDAELLAASGISVLESSAWLYPGDGFFPQLATVKNPENTEILALSLDKTGSKAAFSVYNSGEATTAVAVISIFDGTRLIGTKVETISIPAKYSVHTAYSEKISGADSVSIMLLDSDSTLSPKADKDEF